MFNAARVAEKLQRPQDRSYVGRVRAVGRQGQVRLVRGAGLGALAGGLRDGADQQIGVGLARVHGDGSARERQGFGGAAGEQVGTREQQHVV